MFVIKSCNSAWPDAIVLCIGLIKNRMLKKLFKETFFKECQGPPQLAPPNFFLHCWRPRSFNLISHFNWFAVVRGIAFKYIIINKCPPSYNRRSS